MLRRHFLPLPATFFLALQTRNILNADTQNTSATSPKRIVFLADTHIGPDVPKHAENLRTLLQEILTLNPRPSHIFILGDLVSTYGKSEEYVEFRDLMEPINGSGIPWYIVVGNHDTRERMFEVMPGKKMEIASIPGKQVGIVKTECVDFVILDSRMDDTRAYMAEKEKYPERQPWDGTMETESIAWLRETLTDYPKPVFVLAHHPLQQTKIGALLAEFPCVVGYLFGHNHQYLRMMVDGTDSFAFPTTSNRPLTPQEPRGFMVMDVQPTQYDFTLYTLEEEHCLKRHVEIIKRK